MKYNYHYNHLSSKFIYGYNKLLSIKKFINQCEFQDFKVMYDNYILTYVTYGILIWCPKMNQNKRNKLQSVMNNSIKYFFNSYVNILGKLLCFINLNQIYVFESRKFASKIIRLNDTYPGFNCFNEMINKWIDKLEHEEIYNLNISKFTKELYEINNTNSFDFYLLKNKKNLENIQLNIIIK